MFNAFQAGPYRMNTAMNTSSGIRSLPSRNGLAAAGQFRSAWPTGEGFDHGLSA
jgi:hypothetical protein